MSVQAIHIGQQLRALRLNSKKSRQQLAKQIQALGVPITPEIIAHWETGQADVPAQFVPVLARSLNAQVVDLLPDLSRHVTGDLASNAGPLRRVQNRSNAAKQFAIQELRFTRPPRVRIRIPTAAYLTENERSPLDAMILTETRALLLTVIRKLEHRRRQVLILHYYRGLTASQIAAKLNLPVSNIAARICSARQKLHSLLCCNPAWRSLRAELRDQFPPLDHSA